MYPSFGFKDTGSSDAEPLLYKMLKQQLPDEFHVIHSIPWMSSVVAEFTDSSIGEIDFLIFHPTLGALAIEVKGGIVGHNYDGFYYQKELGNKTFIDPIKQLRRGIFALQDLLISRGLDIKFAQAYCFPHSKADLNQLPPAVVDSNDGLSMKIVLDIRDNKRLHKRIVEIMTIFKQSNKTPEHTPDSITAIINAIVPNSDYGPCWYARIKNDEFLWLRLTEEQQECLERVDGKANNVINGWPGSGKTVVGISAARKLSKQHNKILFLTFNNLLSDFISKELKHTESCNVFTFHRLCKNAEYFLGMVASEQTQDWFDTISKRSLERAINKGFLNEYEHLIIDEAQVFDKSWLYMLNYAFSDKPITALCDPTQVFPNESAVTVAELAELFNVEPFLLTSSLRMPKNVCNRLKQLNPPSHSVTNPREIEVDTLQEIACENVFIKLKEIINQLLADNVPPNAIAILVRYNIREWAEYTQKGITVETFRRFRGMESPIVIVLPDHNSEEVEYFCAYSRATSRCIVLLNALCIKQGGYKDIGKLIYESEQQPFIDEVAEQTEQRMAIEAKIRANLALVSTKYRNLTEQQQSVALDSISISFSESWNGYIIPPQFGAETARTLWSSYISQSFNQLVYTWNSTSTHVEIVTYENIENYDCKYYGIEFCHTCAHETPRSVNTINQTIEKKCLVCCKHKNKRNSEFEQKLIKYDHIINQPEQYSIQEKKNLPIYLFALAGLRHKGLLKNDAKTASLICSHDKPISQIICAFTLIHLIELIDDNHTELMNMQALERFGKWLPKDKNKEQYKALINGVFIKLQYAGILTRSGKGKSTINKNQVLELLSK